MTCSCHNVLQCLLINSSCGSWSSIELTSVIFKVVECMERTVSLVKKGHKGWKSLERKSRSGGHNEKRSDEFLISLEALKEILTLVEPTILVSRETECDRAFPSRLRLVALLQALQANGFTLLWVNDTCFRCLHHLQTRLFIPLQ